ncbi:hypothetical protein [Microbacterium sp. K24]|uniref:hypothetical protein n=1 Tax=Microbacterium sp. K24 TaxID=2305446 RepID=UPI00144465F3|nr:hypothetical protein [Microbacterium sp. K24]
MTLTPLDLIFWALALVVVVLALLFLAVGTWIVAVLIRLVIRSQRAKASDGKGNA